MAQVTNSDIMEKLGNMEARLIAVQAQAEKTNGRVTKAEEFINALKAVDAYKKENPTAQITAKTVTVVQPRWFQNERLAYAVAAVLIAVATAITIIAGGLK